MLDLAELVRGRRPDTLGGRVRRDEVGVLLLERLQLVEEPVVIGVRDLRVVEDVVAVEMVLDLLAQLAARFWTVLDGLEDIEELLRRLDEHVGFCKCVDR